MSQPDDSETGGVFLELYDYRRRVAAMYATRDAALESGGDPEQAWAKFRLDRALLFASHPQSPVERERQDRIGPLDYFPYDPSAVVHASIQPTEPLRLTVDLGLEGEVRLVAAARLSFELFGNDAALTVYWIEGYGGGLFVPFRDRTAPDHTYGGGRYLFDTVKGTGFGCPPTQAWQPPPTDPFPAAAPREQTQRLISDGTATFNPIDSGRRVRLDFNYAYNPSCAYSPRWTCPLAPAENALPFSISAGERRFH